MFDSSCQNLPAVAEGMCQEKPTFGFYRVTPCTKDTGRVILGGGFAGVPENNKDKVRGSTR